MITLQTARMRGSGRAYGNGTFYADSDYWIVPGLRQPMSRRCAKVVGYLIRKTPVNVAVIPRTVHAAVFHSRVPVDIQRPRRSVGYFAGLYPRDCSAAPRVANAIASALYPEVYVKTETLHSPTVPLDIIVLDSGDQRYARLRSDLMRVTEWRKLDPEDVLHLLVAPWLLAYAKHMFPIRGEVEDLGHGR